MIRVLIVDDHPALRGGVAALIGDQPDMVVVGEAGTGAQSVELFDEFSPDVTLMDLQLPDMDGEEAIREIIAKHPGARILTLTMFGGEGTIRGALAAGAVGFILKDMLRREIVTGIRRAHAGHKVLPGVVAERLADAIDREALTPREVEVLKELALGRSNRGIADALGISEGTVKVHLRHVMEKLEASDRTDAVMRALQRGLIRLR